MRPAYLALIPACALLAACAGPDPYMDRSYPAAGYPQTYYGPTSQRVEYGTVEAIEWFRDGDNRPTGLGAVIGGVAGGVLGHQIGSGSGNTAATIAGALGGAYVGNEMERANDRDRYRVIVRLDNGSTLAVNEVGEGQLRVGDRVRVIGNRVYRY
jgi:outer membrane lipoprotein SlyB